MNKSDEPDQDKLRPKHSPSDEAMRVIEEYNGLRAIIEKLRNSLSSPETPDDRRNR